MVGLLQLHWAMVIVFANIHNVIRLLYLNAEQQNQASDNNIQPTDRQKTVVTPPAICNLQFASVIGGGIIAGIIYAIGHGLHYGFHLIVSF